MPNEREIIALAEMQRRDAARGVGLDRGGASLRAKPRRDHKPARGEARGVGVGEAHLKAFGVQRRAGERRIQRHRAASSLDLALQGEHVAV